MARIKGAVRTRTNFHQHQQQAEKALAEVHDGTSLQDLVDQESEPRIK